MVARLPDSQFFNKDSVAENRSHFTESFDVSCKKEFVGGLINNCGCVTAIIGNASDIKFPEEGHTLAPWVRIEMENSNSVITVGNQSSPNTPTKHSACIKSMEFGHSDGMMAKIVIHDQGGSEFVNFMSNLLKDMTCANNAALLLKLQFGWIKAGCTSPVLGAASPPYYCYIDSIEANFSQGKFQYEITGRDILGKSFEGSDDKSPGSDDSPVALMDAIIQLCTNREIPPSISSVRFLRKTTATDGIDIGFEDGEVDGNGIRRGIKHSWRSEGLNKLEIIKGWLEQHMTDRGKPWKMVYNPENPGGELVCWEDIAPDCTEKIDWELNKIGSYIVNGGRLSPVIDFNPNIRWDLSRLNVMGGEFDPNVSTNGKLGESDCPSLTRAANPSTGHTGTSPADAATIDVEGKGATKKSGKNLTKNTHSLSLYPDEIGADLVIIGNPIMIRPVFCFGLNVAIAFINPYNITGPDGGGCGEWLAEPPCNSILSNRGWIITSVRHNIEAGSYRTTLGIKLFVPGIQMDKLNTLGADDLGWQPPANCPSASV